MSFIADKQTLDDLNLLGKYKSNSVYSLFNKVQTAGGERLLDHMFRHPLTDAAAINQRSSVFRFFEQQSVAFPFEKAAFESMENYLSAGGSGNRLTASAELLLKKTRHALGFDKEYPSIVKGLQTTIQLLNQLIDFVARLEAAGTTHPFYEAVRTLSFIFSDSRLRWLKAERNKQQFTLREVFRYDILLRHTLRQEMTSILQWIYEMDVNIAVAGTARTKGFSYAHALPEERYSIRIENCRHPAIEKAVPNSVTMQRNSNVIFLTGANMAGKSTFMKSFSIAVYLAHMGFPVAAAAMEFSVRDGLYTSINVPDNLQLGYSHFYAEVRRVKTVAEDVSTGRNLLVIFDELFKGTNVKDAYDATLTVTEAFADYHNCFFIISTHIIEVADALKKCANLQFRYFPTIMEGNIPRYTYQLQEGVTSDRHGMMIIENEGIVAIIRNQLSHSR